MRSLSLNAAMNCERREQQTFRAERYLNPIRNSTMIHWSGYNWKRLRLSAVLLAPNRFKSLVIAAQMSLQLNCLVIVPSEIFEHVAWSSLMPWKAWYHINWNVCLKKYISQRRNVFVGILFPEVPALVAQRPKQLVRNGIKFSEATKTWGSD